MAGHWADFISLRWSELFFTLFFYFVIAGAGPEVGQVEMLRLWRRQNEASNRSELISNNSRLRQVARGPAGG